MVLLWLIVAFILVYAVLVTVSVARISMPLVPVLTPGEIGGARDPEFFALQEQAFVENGYETVGDFCWHERLTTVAMRVFLSKTGASYGWTVEESFAGAESAQRSVSVLTEFTDGSLLDTTSSQRSSLVAPPWFLCERLAPDTELLLRRHKERLAALLAQDKEAVTPSAAELPETIRRNERRLGEYQVEIGRMRLAKGRLRYNAGAVLGTVLYSLGRSLSAPFMRRKN